MLQDILPLPIHHLVVLQVLHRDGEVVGGLVVDDVPHHRAELDVLLDVLLGPSTLEVVEQHLPIKRVLHGLLCFPLPWWKGGDRLAKVLLKGVIRELQTFLGSIGPQVPD